MVGKCRLLSVVFCLGAGFASAEDKAAGPKVHTFLQYRGTLLSDDHGLEKTTGFTPKGTSSIEYYNNLIVMGQLGAASFVVADFLTLDKEQTLNATGTYKVNDMLSVTGGQGSIKWGGYQFDNWDWQDSNSTINQVMYQGPLDSLGLLPVLQFDVSIAGAGAVTLQLTNDVVAQDAATAANPLDALRFNTHEKVIPVLAYKGTFGPVSPVLQFFKFDNGHSTHINLGVEAKVQNITAHLNYMTINRALNITGMSGKENVMSSTYLKVAYEMPKLLIARLSYSMFSTKDFADRKGNASAAFADNNQNIMVLGFDSDFAGPLFRPYLEISMKSGKYMKDPTTVATNPTGPTESRSSNLILVGVKGMI